MIRKRDQEDGGRGERVYLSESQAVATQRLTQPFIALSELNSGRGGRPRERMGQRLGLNDRGGGGRGQRQVRSLLLLVERGERGRGREEGGERGRGIVVEGGVREGVSLCLPKTPPPSKKKGMFVFSWRGTQ